MQWMWACHAIAVWIYRAGTGKPNIVNNAGSTWTNRAHASSTDPSPTWGMQGLSASLQVVLPLLHTALPVHDSDTTRPLELCCLFSSCKWVAWDTCTLSPATSTLPSPMPMFLVQTHNGCCLPSKSPINASNSPRTSLTLRQVGHCSSQGLLMALKVLASCRKMHDTSRVLYPPLLSAWRLDAGRALKSFESHCQCIQSIYIHILRNRHMYRSSLRWSPCRITTGG